MISTKNLSIGYAFSVFRGFKSFQVFVSEPEMELRTPYDAIDSVDMVQPDKQFLESLKDAMRTIAMGSNIR